MSKLPFVELGRAALAQGPRAQVAQVKAAMNSRSYSWVEAAPGSVARVKIKRLRAKLKRIE